MNDDELLNIKDFILPDVPISGYFKSAFWNLNSIKDIEKVEVKLDIVREIVNLMSISTDYGRLFATLLAYDFDLLLKTNKIERAKIKKVEKEKGQKEDAKSEKLEDVQKKSNLKEKEEIKK
jgi:hypothetical protein